MLHERGVLRRLASRNALRNVETHFRTWVLLRKYSPVSTNALSFETNFILRFRVPLKNEIRYYFSVGILTQCLLANSMCFRGTTGPVKSLVCSKSVSVTTSCCPSNKAIISRAQVVCACVVSNLIVPGNNSILFHCPIFPIPFGTGRARPRQTDPNSVVSFSSLICRDVTAVSWLVSWNWRVAEMQRLTM